MNTFNLRRILYKHNNNIYKCTNINDVNVYNRYIYVMYMRYNMILICSIDIVFEYCVIFYIIHIIENNHNSS